jgi:hypothetical protein
MTALFVGNLCLPSGEPQAQARFVTLKGKVQVFEGGRWVKAAFENKLTQESSVQVGYRSGAVVALPEGSQVALKENTVLSFNELATDLSKPRTELYIQQGGLGAYVKKPASGQKNSFIVKTPTVVVGVRGSFMELARHGTQHEVKAIESAAFLRNKVTPTTNRERLQKAFAVLERAYLMDRDEERRAGLLAEKATSDDDRQALVALQQPPADAPEFLQAIKEIKDHRTLTRELLVRQEKVFEAKASDRKAVVQTLMQVRALTMLQLRWAEAAYRAELEAYLIELKKSDRKKDQNDDDDEVFFNNLEFAAVPQGDSARASGELHGPYSTRTFDSRAERNFSSGSSAAEQSFLGNNTDIQSGFGNDVQGLYNSINTVTQPSSVGEPTLQKF